MDHSPTKEELSVALSRFRARVESHNREALTRLIRQAEEAQPNYDNPIGPRTPEGASAGRLRYVRNLLGISDRRQNDGDDSRIRINSPSDVLLPQNWDALVRGFDLDGVRDVVNAAERERNRTAYRDGMLAAFDEVEQDDEHEGALGFPKDLWHLAGMVDSLEGHGWPEYRERGRQIRAWEGVGDGAADGLVDGEALEELGWESRAAWECGRGPETICYVSFCRALNEEEYGEGSGGWRWRYLIDMGQNGVEVFNDLVQLLDWYGEVHVPDLEHLDRYTDEVFGS
ncbi:hypothetical protein PspLS_03661 [Pyricularia sp. CBS 133598]|nr:hypothetical protein PspLS_03661 [Pyricularia sp. CBS 133598]